MLPPLYMSGFIFNRDIIFLLWLCFLIFVLLQESTRLCRVDAGFHRGQRTNFWIHTIQNLVLKTNGSLAHATPCHQAENRYNRSSNRFWTILLTGWQTNSTQNITSLAEVMNQHLNGHVSSRDCNTLSYDVALF